jgi:serine/threonine protein kinase
MVLDGLQLVQPFTRNERTWLARDGGLPLVIKFPPEEAARNESIRDQFMMEMWGLTRLSHAAFASAHVPPRASALYYCMDYVEAPTLKEFLGKRQRLTVEQGLGLARFLLDAGQHLAGADLAHGDFKPENILVLETQADLAFKLIDFGNISGLFSTHTRAGTPSYLAPERFGGAPLCEATELFSIGVTLYESLTGVLPYGEIEPFQTPRFHRARAPSEANPNVPPWLDSLVLQCIAIEPGDRQQNFSEIQFALNHPDSVKPFFRRDAPLLERNPLAFYKTGFFLLLVLVLCLAARLLGS